MGVKGSPGAERFEAFVREFGERAFQVAYRLSDNIEEAKEIVQEAFVRLWRNWEDVGSSRTPDSWFFTVLRNIFKDARRRVEYRKGVPIDAAAGELGSEESYADILPSEEEAIIAQLERKESAEMVRDALAELAYEQRVVLTLCDMQGLSYEEIGRVLELPPGTVRSRISRAREAFRKVLARSMEVIQ